MIKKNQLLIKLACFISVPFFSVSASSIDKISQAKMLSETWLEAQKDYEQLPSLSVAVIKDQDIVFSGAWGYANPTKKILANTDTLYSICSNSKLFTSVALMQLRDAGKVALKTPIKEYLSWFDVEQSDPNSSAVTLKGLLTHSSGMMREAKGYYWNSPDYPFPTQEEIKETIYQQEMLYADSRHYQYSNIGLTLVGEVVQKTSGNDFHDYIRENILTPLKMNNTYSSIPKDKYGNDMSIGYSALNRNGLRDKVKIFDARAIDPAAGFVSSVHDYAKFAMWQHRLLKDGGNEVLNHNTLREMQRPHWILDNWKSARGLGFSVYRTDGTTYVGHGGSCPGYVSTFMLNPKTRVTTIVMINANDSGPRTIAKSIHNIFSGILSDKVDIKGEVNKTSLSASSHQLRLSEYNGIFEEKPWGKDSLVMEWQGTLGLFKLGSKDPLSSMTKFKHVDADTFVRVRKDGSEAEKVFFVRNEQGEVIQLDWHGYLLKKSKN